MALPNEQAHQAGGLLIADPTNATPPSFGGTVLGTLREVALVPTWRAEEITNEEDGAEVDGITYLGEEWVCTTVLSNFDTDALATLFPNTSLAAPFRRIFYPGATFTIGQDLRDRKVKLFLAPFDPDLEAGFLLTEAVPIPGEGAVLEFSAYTDVAIAITFRGMSPAGGGAMIDINDSDTLAAGF